jgi:hypothetical protein
MERSNSKDGWNEGEDREDTEYLQREKELYLKMYPNNAEFFGDENGG